jgi:hypothetical protein
MSSDSEPDVHSNEARRSGFSTLKKKGEDHRKSLTSKLLADPAKFDRIMRKWREADEEGYGLLDKESFVDVLFIQVRGTVNH